MLCCSCARHKKAAAELSAQLAASLHSAPPPQQSPRDIDCLELPAFMVPDFLSADECSALISVSEEKGYEQAKVNTGGGHQALQRELRSSGRCIIDSALTADRLFDRLQPHLDTLGLSNGPRGGWTCAGLNERLRFLRYTDGDYFRWHHDGSYVRPLGDPRGEPDRSLMTMCAPAAWNPAHHAAPVADRARFFCAVVEG